MKFRPLYIYIYSPRTVSEDKDNELCIFKTILYNGSNKLNDSNKTDILSKKVKGKIHKLKIY